MTNTRPPRTYTEILKSIQGAAESEAVFRRRTIESLDWYREKIYKHFGQKAQSTREAFIESLPYKFDRIYPGWLYTFQYQPKHKNTSLLPYYDQFPLILMLHETEKGFLGINFHYLAPRHRALFMGKLYNYEMVDPVTGGTRININYEILKRTKSLSFYKPCIKHYLYPQMRTFFVAVKPYEWDIALFLPTDKFIGKGREAVWDLSKKAYQQ